MTAVGGIVETKEIGISVGIANGTHNNTVYDSTNGYIVLKTTDTDGNGNPVYAETGEWISDVIEIDDKFKNYQKVFTTHINNGSEIDDSLSSIKIQTRVSKDGVTWDEWVDANADGTINSATTWDETLADETIKTHVKQYAQVKIVFNAGFATDVFLISEFDNSTDKELFTNSEFLDSSNGLILNREYSFYMTKDVSCT